MALVALVLPLAALTFVLPAASPAMATQLVAHAPITLFSGPGDGFERTDTVAAESRVNVLWCTGDASWCLVEVGGGQGWAPSASLISKAANSRSGSAATASATANNVNEALAKSTSAASGGLSAASDAASSATAAATAPESAVAAAVKSVAH